MCSEQMKNRIEPERKSKATTTKVKRKKLAKSSEWRNKNHGIPSFQLSSLFFIFLFFVLSPSSFGSYKIMLETSNHYERANKYFGGLLALCLCRYIAGMSEIVFRANATSKFILSMCSIRLLVQIRTGNGIITIKVLFFGRYKTNSAKTTQPKHHQQDKCILKFLAYFTTLAKHCTHTHTLERANSFRADLE